MAQTGHKLRGKLYASVDDLARAVGVPVLETGGISLANMAGNLRHIGAIVGPLQHVQTLRQAARLLTRDGSVVMVSVKVMKHGRQDGGHALYIFYDALGRLRVMDRTGVYGDLAAVARRYQVDELVPRAAIAVKNAYAKFFGPKGTATVAIEVLAVTTEEPQTVQSAYDARSNR